MMTLFPHCLVCDCAKRTYPEHELVAQDADDKVFVFLRRNDDFFLCGRSWAPQINFVKASFMVFQLLNCSWMVTGASMEKDATFADHL